MNNELIEAATAVIARWDSTDWKAAPTAEVMNRLRAALSATPEPLPEVEEWIAIHGFDATTEDYRNDELRAYIAKLTAAHAAEIERLKALLRDAASDLAEWGSYVPEYFVEKHKLDDDIQKYREAGERTK